ncbi:MAG: hypothetical protein KIB52_06180 [Clostridiales bacterium]|nr:hypothetical protein [Clostridiales bacterium]MDU3490971.1 hypothetical protein [Clostridiales bacterium]
MPVAGAFLCFYTDNRSRIGLNCKETGVVLAGLGVYSYNTGDDEAAEIQNEVRKKVMEHDLALQVHGFYLDIEKKDMRFDVVMSFDIKPQDGLRIIYDEIGRAYQEYSINIIPYLDVSG